MGIQSFFTPISQTTVVIGMLFLNACLGETPMVSVQPSSLPEVPIYHPLSSPLPAPTVIPSVSPVPQVLGPCEGKAIPIGSGHWTYDVFLVSTSPTSSDQLFLRQDCTWNAYWSDKTWNGGGTAYDAEGTFAFSGNVITFQPSGLSYTITTTPYQIDNPGYVLSLRNPNILYPFWYDHRHTHDVKTSLAFEDWTTNTYLLDSYCKASQDNFNSCVTNDRYHPTLNMNGKRSVLYKE